jgi:ABC-type nitrate/sulfonate/bicarbonate transport system substrate-binding protein
MTNRLNRRQRWLTRCLGIVVGVIATTVLAACGSGGASQQGGSGVTLGLTFVSGHPDLRGQTIDIAVGGTPQATDTTDYLVTKVLSSWGANSSIIAQSGDPAAVSLVLAGRAQIAAVGVTSAINSKLTAFAPAQPKLDYRLVALSGINSVQDLRGKVYGYSNPHGTEALMLGVILAKYGIPYNAVPKTLAGSSSVRAEALLTHHIQVTDVPTDAWLTLEQHGFKSLETVADIAPQLADSYMLSTPSWLKSNSGDAEAVAEAWLEAAEIFQANQSEWVNAAATYTGGSLPRSQIVATYQALRQANIWAPQASEFAASSAQYNENAATNVAAISSSPPLQSWFTATYWDKAVSALKLPS